MRDTYRRAMQALYLACIVLSGLAHGGDHADDPRRRVHALRDERPAAVARARLGDHDGVLLVRRRRRRLPRQPADRGRGADARRSARAAARRCSGACTPACCSIAAFMLGYGVHLCLVTWGNTIAEFPSLSVGVVYMPIPIGGLLTLLFIIEKIWLGEPPQGRRHVQRPGRWSLGVAHGHPGPARLVRRAVRARRAGRLRARASRR